MQLKFEKGFSQSLNEKQYAFLDFISREITVSKRPIEAWILKQLSIKKTLTDNEILSGLRATNIFYDDDSLKNVASILDLSYFMDRNRQKYGDIPLINHFDNKWELTFEFKSALSSKEFKRYFEDAINVNLLKLQNHPTDFNTRFIVGEKYYRTDVIKLLNWSKEQNGQNVGGYIMRSDSKFLPVFIALEKTEKFQNKMAYEDSFLSRSTMRWFSKSGRSTTSKTESKIISNKNFGMIQLFVKKSDDDKREGKDFYYLGSARVIKAEDKVAKNSDNKKTKLIDFTLRLQREVDLSLYRALIES